MPDSPVSVFPIKFFEGRSPKWTVGCACSLTLSLSNPINLIEFFLYQQTSPWRKIRSLVTSPFIQTYKRQKYPWIQLAGHQGKRCLCFQIDQILNYFFLFFLVL